MLSVLAAMAYQKIGDKKGGSDSEAKLKAIHIPKNLAKQSFLDVGCSQGFFCRAARERGATYIIGLDHSESAIEAAVRQDRQGTYRHGDWYSLLEELVREGQTFDVIIHLSAFHYVSDHVRFLALIHQLLKPGGLFILECGVANVGGGPRYVDHRRTGITLPYTRHITLALLQQLLDRFASRTEGKSVDQPGDSVPRRVFHCHTKKPVALLVGADSGVGKSTFSSLIASHKSVANIKMDYILKDLVTCPIASVEAAVNAHMKNINRLAI